jgi:hypothetical protein
MPEIAEVKQDPSISTKVEDGTTLLPEKKTKTKPDEIDVSLQDRIAAGSLTTTVSDKKVEAPEVYQLKQTGEILIKK